ncbi:hypothetical protein YC2023_122888 [Brassica napus]
MCVVDGTLMVSVIVVVVGCVVDEILVVRGSVVVLGVLWSRLWWSVSESGFQVILVPPDEVGPEKENKKSRVQLKIGWETMVARKNSRPWREIEFEKITKGRLGN